MQPTRRHHLQRSPVLAVSARLIRRGCADSPEKQRSRWSRNLRSGKMFFPAPRFAGTQPHRAAFRCESLSETRPRSVPSNPPWRGGRRSASYPAAGGLIGRPDGRTGGRLGHCRTDCCCSTSARQSAQKRPEDCPRRWGGTEPRFQEPGAWANRREHGPIRLRRRTIPETSVHTDYLEHPPPYLRLVSLRPTARVTTQRNASETGCLCTYVPIAESCQHSAAERLSRVGVDGDDG
jgi:hypothetical protein